MSRVFIEFVWILIILLLLAAGGFLIYLGLLSYFKYHIDLSFAPDSSNKGINLLEIVYFIGNTIVALVASATILFARGQLKHAEESRRASIYIELNTKFNSENIQYSYRKIVSFYRSYDSFKLQNECLSQYAHRILLDYHKDHIQISNTLSGNNTEYRKTLLLLQFLEETGVLVARKYLKHDDLFNYMGITIIATEDVLKDHIKWIRNTSNDPSVYANSLTLMKLARNAKTHRKVHSFNEGEYRII